jgi:hypothetical protein
MSPSLAPLPLLFLARSRRGPGRGMVSRMARWRPFRRTTIPEELDYAPRLRLGPGTLIRQYSVFVSSGDDLVDQRGMVKGIAENSVNPSLAEHNHKVRLEAELWEKSPPRRLFGRETIDDEFVAKAKASDLVMTLLWARLGSGTRKEIEAVLATRTELSLLWFVNRTEQPRTSAAKYLGKLIKRQELRLKRAGRPGEAQNAEVISRVLFTAALEAIARPPEDTRARL